MFGTFTNIGESKLPHNAILAISKFAFLPVYQRRNKSGFNKPLIRSALQGPTRYGMCIAMDNQSRERINDRDTV